MTDHQPIALTAFQIAVAELFFSLPESDGFLLAGGAALAAQQLTARPTRDLDLFTRSGRSSVPAARDAFVRVARDRGWSVRVVRDSETFCRLLIRAAEDLLIDLALDSPPTQQPATSPAGPTFALEELAARKLIALFDRAEARDFADVYTLVNRYNPNLLLHHATQIDPGLDPAALATMIGALDRFTDDEIPVDPSKVDALRTFFREWRQQLISDNNGSNIP
jgi:hypothetical protein